MTASPAREAELLAAAFFFAHDLLRPPSPEQWSHLTSKGTGQVWATLADLTGLAHDMHLPRNAEVYEMEYRSAMEHRASAVAQTSGSPLVLAESHFNQDEPASSIRQENLRFYHAFGLRLGDDEEETADHLRRQLEFVGYLFRMEATLSQREGKTEDVRAIRLARPRYVARHLLSWLPRALAEAERAGPAWLRGYLQLTIELGRAAAHETSRG